MRGHSIQAGGFAAHGGRLAAASALFPNAPRPWIDLSTGINRRSYPAPRASHEQRNRLPEGAELAKLESIAAGAFGVAEPMRVVAVAGTELALRLLPHVLGASRAAVVGPTYSSHAAAWERAGVATTTIADALQHTTTVDSAVLTVVNPNNPDGRVVSRDRLLDMHHALAARRGTLIVDEAFADLTPSASICDLAGSERAPRLVVLRSFGKFYGLAGVRLGFIVAAPAISAAVRRLMGDWPVSGDALVAGQAAYSDARWAERTRTRVARLARRLDALLMRHGFEIVGGTALYRLARAADAAEKFQRLLEAGVLTRPFDYDPTLLRFGLPHGEAEWSRLSAALEASV